MTHPKDRNPKHQDGHFDSVVADTYDQRHGNTDRDEIDRTVACISGLAAGGDVLEFAIGTGRIALPLAALGIPVKGIELSSAMVDKLRKKDAAGRIDVTIGDMTTTRVSGSFSLVLLVFNTIDNLTTQDAQIACFQNACRHLGSGGRFLVETQVPPLQDLPFGETTRAFASDDTHMGTDTFDIATQNYWSRHIWLENGETSTLNIPFRYTWPAELDLMARLAGMELEHRWADWNRAPFDRFSRKHISVWKKT